MEISKINSLVELFFKKIEEIDNKKTIRTNFVRVKIKLLINF